MYDYFRIYLLVEMQNGRDNFTVKVEIEQSARNCVYVKYFRGLNSGNQTHSCPYMLHELHKLCAHDDVMIPYKARTLDSGVVVNDL